MGPYFRFTCPNCSNRLKALPEQAGKRARCSCGHRFVVPAAPGTGIKPREWPAVQLRGLPAAAPPLEAAIDSRDLSTPVRFPWLGIAAAMTGLALLAIGSTVLGIWMLSGERKARRPTENAVALVVTEPPRQADPAPRPVQPPPAIQPSPAQIAAVAFQAIQALENQGGDDYEALSAAYARFLVEHPAASPEHRQQARQKIDTELPARMDERDYQRVSTEAAATRSDDEARKRWERYLSAHPKGRYLEQVRRRLDDLATWKVELVDTKVDNRFEIDSDTHYRPTGEGSRLVLVTVRFEARSAMPGTLEDRIRPAANFLSEDAVGFLKGQGKIVQTYAGFIPDLRKRPEQPARLFMANQVGLVLEDRTRLAPVWTSTPSPFAHGSTVVNGRANASIGNPAATPAVLRFIRGDGHTAALVQPGKSVLLTLVFNMLAEHHRAELHFYDSRPIPITMPPR